MCLIACYVCPTTINAEAQATINTEAPTVPSTGPGFAVTISISGSIGGLMYVNGFFFLCVCGQIRPSVVSGSTR